MMLNISKCVNLLEISSELFESILTLQQDLMEKVSYNYLLSQISYIIAQLQNDKTEIASIKNECENFKKQLTQTIIGRSFIIFRLKILVKHVNYCVLAINSCIPCPVNQFYNTSNNVCVDQENIYVISIP
ncbi:Hypothetical_protein [Hexamita inflata]|uniref:Hypothetical_protein n=1 Tax=Hexamita inflata TaxID=28002 RepID=A0AA86REQ2_9EUKA|nr:Hypothetical protein HINF_LOCUS63920 [Hexamita inflata]